jgi:CelD/BcsL family acetyltransferase involved in cellulose biosynthesis
MPTPMPSDPQIDPYRVTQISLEELTDYFHEQPSSLPWECPFVQPFWLRSWATAFGKGQTALFLCVLHNDQPVGLLPLKTDGSAATFFGSPDVCDYQDLVAAPGQTSAVVAALIKVLRARGIQMLDLNTIRRPSALWDGLQACTSQDLQIAWEAVEAGYAMDLPASWEEYLQRLKAKQRHEIRRKLRRLHEYGTIEFDTIAPTHLNERDMQQFFSLFTASRADKADFMNPAMRVFFNNLLQGAAAAGVLRLSFLRINGRPAASTLCFAINDCLYLYNNGYDRTYAPVSVGLLSKVYTIRQGIEEGFRRYDFLKGSEPYKHRLGGRPVAMFRCRIYL